jgi:hypothetical protein
LFEIFNQQQGEPEEPDPGDPLPGCGPLTWYLLFFLGLALITLVTAYRFGLLNAAL